MGHKLFFLDENQNNYKLITMCRNPSLGLATKAKGLQGCEPKGSSGVKAKALQECGPKGSPGVKARGSPRVTSHTPGSVRKCEGV